MMNKWFIRTAVALYIITFALNLGVVIRNDRSKTFEVLPEFMEYREHYYPYEHDYVFRAYKKGLSYVIETLDDDDNVTASFELSRREYAYVTSFIEDNRKTISANNTNHDTKITVKYQYPLKDEESYVFIQHDTIGWAGWLLDLKSEHPDVETAIFEIMEKYNAKSGISAMNSGKAQRYIDLDFSRVLFYQAPYGMSAEYTQKPMVPREVVEYQTMREAYYYLHENMWLTYNNGINSAAAVFGYDHGLNGTHISHSKVFVLDTDILIVYCVPDKNEYRNIVISSVDPLVRKQLIRDIKIALMTNGKSSGLPGSYLLTHVMVICFSETFILALVLILFSLKEQKPNAIIERKKSRAKTNGSQRKNA